MASDREVFNSSGPLYLTQIDWTNPNHRQSVAASLVQGVYILERDHQQNRQGPEALAPPWWEFFHFQLIRKLIDDVDFSIFGAIYEFKPPTSDQNQLPPRSPKYVIAFRGTVFKGDSWLRDILLDLKIIFNRLHGSSCFKRAMEAVQEVVNAVGSLNVWLAGHSLGSAIAMLVGKDMAKSGFILEAFLFNPPFLLDLIDRITNEKLKDGIQTFVSFVKAASALAEKVLHGISESEDSFTKLSAWVPCLFVNPDDFICSQYISYFERRKKMEKKGLRCVEKQATQISLRSKCFSAVGGKSSDPLHLLPSAKLTINLSPSPDIKKAHGISQWWNQDLNLKSEEYHYE